MKTACFRLHLVILSTATDWSAYPASCYIGSNRCRGTYPSHPCNCWIAHSPANTAAPSWSRSQRPSPWCQAHPESWRWASADQWSSHWGRNHCPGISCRRHSAARGRTSAAFGSWRLRGSWGWWPGGCGRSWTRGRCRRSRTAGRDWGWSARWKGCFGRSASAKSYPSSTQLHSWADFYARAGLCAYRHLTEPG